MARFYYVLLTCLLFTIACSQTSEGEAQEVNSAAKGAEPAAATAAAEETTKSSGVPAQGAEVTFKKQYPNAEEVSWAKDANGYHEASFSMQGEKYRADYTEQGKWVETENTIKFDKLPKAVKDAIRTQYKKDDIAEIERVEHASKGVFYDVEFKKKGKNQDVEYRENGEIVKQ